MGLSCCFNVSGVAPGGRGQISLKIVSHASVVIVRKLCFRKNTPPPNFHSERVSCLEQNMSFDWNFPYFTVDLLGNKVTLRDVDQLSTCYWLWESPQCKRL